MWKIGKIQFQRFSAMRCWCSATKYQLTLFWSIRDKLVPGGVLKFNVLLLVRTSLQCAKQLASQSRKRVSGNDDTNLQCNETLLKFLTFYISRRRSPVFLLPALHCDAVARPPLYLFRTHFLFLSRSTLGTMVMQLLDAAKLASSSGTDTDCTDDTGVGTARDASAAAAGIGSRWWSGSRCACIPLCYN